MKDLWPAVPGRGCFFGFGWGGDLVVVVVAEVLLYKRGAGKRGRVCSLLWGIPIFFSARMGWDEGLALFFFLPRGIRSGDYGGSKISTVMVPFFGSCAVLFPFLCHVSGQIRVPGGI